MSDYYWIYEILQCFPELLSGYGTAQCYHPSQYVNICHTKLSAFEDRTSASVISVYADMTTHFHFLLTLLQAQPHPITKPNILTIFCLLYYNLLSEACI